MVEESTIKLKCVIIFDLHKFLEVRIEREYVRYDDRNIIRNYPFRQTWKIILNFFI